MKSLDDIRAAYPHLGLACYAYAPHGPVTLEILPPDGGKPIKFVGPTEAAAVAAAFPAEDEQPESERPVARPTEPAHVAPPAAPTLPNVFD